MNNEANQRADQAIEYLRLIHVRLNKHQEKDFRHYVKTMYILDKGVNYMDATREDKDEHVYSEMLEQQVMAQIDRDRDSIDGLSGEEEHLAKHGNDNKFDSKPF